MIVFIILRSFLDPSPAVEFPAVAVSPALTLNKNSPLPCHLEVDILTSATSNSAIRARVRAGRRWSSLPADLQPRPHLQARAFYPKWALHQRHKRREREAPKFFDLLACCVFPAGLQLVRLCSLAAGQSCLRVTLWQRPQRVLGQQTWQPPGTVNSHLPYWNRRGAQFERRRAAKAATLPTFGRFGLWNTLWALWGPHLIFII